jgi:CheY-like chemotaxis protein
MSQVKILYAEDDADDLLLFQEAFESHPDVEVVPFENGAELLQCLETTDSLPCLVILDLNMPQLDGRETLVRIRKRREWSHIPVLIFTTSNSAIDKKFALQWDVDLVTKPLLFSDMTQLADKMVAICSASSRGLYKETYRK